MHCGLLADLRRLGVRLSLDDFGTGYSSLTHLSELPIQQLKIDRSFVSQIHDRRRDRAIVGAVADLAGHLDIEVVAEGIETAGDRGAAAPSSGASSARATTSPSRWPPSCCRCGSDQGTRRGHPAARSRRRGHSSCAPSAEGCRFGIRSRRAVPVRKR